MIEKVEFCSAEIMVNWLRPIRLLSMQNQVEKWLEIPHFCCHFYIFSNVAAKHVLNHWFIDDYTPQTLFLWRNIVAQLAFG